MSPMRPAWSLFSRPLGFAGGSPREINMTGMVVDGLQKLAKCLQRPDRYTIQCETPAESAAQKHLRPARSWPRRGRRDSSLQSRDATNDAILALVNTARRHSLHKEETRSKTPEISSRLDHDDLETQNLKKIILGGGEPYHVMFRCLCNLNTSTQPRFAQHSVPRGCWPNDQDQRTRQIPTMEAAPSQSMMCPPQRLVRMMTKIDSHRTLVLF